MLGVPSSTLRGPAFRAMRACTLSIATNSACRSDLARWIRASALRWSWLSWRSYVFTSAPSMQ
jgi:hypothetical protein